MAKKIKLSGWQQNFNAFRGMTKAGAWWTPPASESTREGRAFNKALVDRAWKYKKEYDQKMLKRMREKQKRR